MKKRVNERTPNGGDYSVIVYMDDAGHETSEEKATQGAIYEYTKDGTCVFDTHFLCK